jgi:hypothetical protein
MPGEDGSRGEQSTGSSKDKGTTRGEGYGGAGMLGITGSINQSSGPEGRTDSRRERTGLDYSGGLGGETSGGSTQELPLIPPEDPEEFESWLNNDALGKLWLALNWGRVNLEVTAMGGFRLRQTSS